MIFLYRCVLSFIGVYCITSERKQEESEEQLLLTKADLFPGMFALGWVNWDELSFLCAFKGRFTRYNSFVCTYGKITTRISLSPFDFCRTIHCTSLKTFLKTLPSKHNTYALFTTRQVKMAVYWPGSFLAWDEVEVIKNVQQNEASIQPSWTNKVGQ